MTSASDNSAPAQNGQGWAAILAAAICCFAMGVIIDLAEASTGISKALNLYNPTGDLSGKRMHQNDMRGMIKRRCKAAGNAPPSVELRVAATVRSDSYATLLSSATGAAVGRMAATREGMFT